MELLFLNIWMRNKWHAVFPNAAINWCIYNGPGKGTPGPHLMGKRKTFLQNFNISLV